MHLIVPVHGADFDILGAMRLMQIRLRRQHPRGIRPLLLHPTRLSQNVWEFARRRSWFRTIFPQNLRWNDLSYVHLLGITQTHHHPEICEHLTRDQKEAFTWGHSAPRLPFAVHHTSAPALSLTAHIFMEEIREGISFPPDDLALFLLAVTEKTWAGLSSHSTQNDFEALEELRRRTWAIAAANHTSEATLSEDDSFGLYIPGNPSALTRQIGNAIILGLREGQRGLLNDLLAEGRDVEINDWPVLLSVARTIGHVQDLDPIIDALWSRQDPAILVAAVCCGGRTRVWARTRTREVDPRRVFVERRPREKDGWTTFSIEETDPERVREILTAELARGLPPDSPAAACMTASPKTVPSNTSVAEAQDLMLKFHLMGLVVVDPDPGNDGSEEKLLGIITRRDLDRAVSMGIWDSPIAPFVPTGGPIVSPDTPARVIRRLMIAHNVSRVPVVADEDSNGKGRLVGIITSRDLLRGLDDPLPLPRRFLPLVPSLELPLAGRMEDLFRKHVPVRYLPVLKRIGERAVERSLDAFLVGGFVRDLLLERPTFDLDVVLTGDALQFAASLQEEVKAELSVFERFRTARLTVGDLKIDFSTARIEHYAEAGALPEVERSGIANDLARRDFTINAMAMELRPDRFLRLLDPFGGGRDLAAKRIRILHAFSFLEDPTRMFRAMRFASRFHFELAEDTRRAMELAIDRGVVGTLSKKRMLAEIARCFAEENPARVVERLFHFNLFRWFHRELTRFSALPERFHLLNGIVRRFSIIGESIDREAVHWTGLLAPLTIDEAERLLVEAGMDSRRRKLVIPSLAALSEVPSKLAHIAENDNWGLYQLLAPLPLEALTALTAFSVDKAGARRIFDFIGRLRPIKPGIGGRELIQAGIPEGPAIGKLLECILEEKVSGRLSHDKKEEIAYARRQFTSLRLS
ncbi:MAG: CBS domain-containing protein [Candidatus Ozemobacteraceae bacterium]